MKHFIKKFTFTICILLLSYSFLCSESYLGTKAPEDPKNIGDIVFNDGSSTPYSENLNLPSEQKNAAVAFIFYVGTDCSDDGENRTLGIGLKSGQKFFKWCDKKASANFEWIDTIYETTKNGSQNFEKIGKWLKEHGIKDDTGDEKKYPAFHYAKKFGEQTKNIGIFNNGWYIPSKEEIRIAYEQYSTINAVCKLCNLPEFDGIFWTSTPGNHKDDWAGQIAWVHRFYDEEGDKFYGLFDEASKTVPYHICVIREF